MTTLDLDALERAARAATPGPWRVVIDDDGNPLSGRPSIQAPDELDCGIVHWDGFVQEYWRSARGDKEIQANAAFIALANPATVLSLISDYRALQERVEGAEKALRPFAEVAEQDIGEDEADDDMFRPMLAFNRAPQPKIGDFRAVLAYFAARTKAGEPHA